MMNNTHQRFILRTTAYGQVRIHPQVFHVGFVNHFHVNTAIFFSHLLRLLPQVSRVTDVWWHVGHVFSHLNALGNGQAVLNGFFTHGEFATGGHIENNFTQWTTRFAFLGLQLQEGVQGIL